MYAIRSYYEHGIGPPGLGDEADRLEKVGKRARGIGGDKEVAHLHHADDVVLVLLVDREKLHLLPGGLAQGFGGGGVATKEELLDARHHQFAHPDFREVDDILDDGLLLLPEAWIVA